MKSKLITTKAPHVQVIAYITDSGEGHHSDYDRLFEAVSQEVGVSLCKVSCTSQIKTPKAPYFYSMFDRTPLITFKNLSVAALRSLSGRRTTGLFFRPGYCFVKGSPKYLLRKYLFKLVAGLPKVYILSIVPFPLSPNIAGVATNWIFDPQLWDLLYLEGPRLVDSEANEDQLTTRAQGRNIIVALGGQNRIKGFDFFADLWGSCPEIRKKFLFVAAGKVAEESKVKAEKFEQDGGLIFNRRISDAELFYFYEKAFAVWSCYAPDYDQSSGIHGRAVQLGVPVIVRKDALIESMGDLLKYPTLALPFDECDKSRHLLINWTPIRIDQSKREALVLDMKNHSIKVLREAFGTDQAA